MRRVIADTVAMISFTTIVGAASELLIVGLSPMQVLMTRMGAIPANLLTSRPYGIYRDFVMRRSGVIGMPGVSGRIARFVVDTIAFTSFKMPLYALLLWLAGANWTEIGVAVVSAMGLTMALGRIYGMYLDMIRRLFGAPGLEGPSER